jgi:hypothetical protein
MDRKTYPALLDDPDIRTDYALIVAGVSAALFAFIYLMLI